MFDRSPTKRRMMRVSIRPASAFVAMWLSIMGGFFATAPANAQLLPDAPLPAGLPPVPCHKHGCRADESIVMDIDYTHYAADHTADVTTLTGDIEAQIDEVAARHPIIAHDGLPRRIIWTTVDGPTHECQQPTDAGILEVEDAEILDSRHQYVFIGQQREEARIAFRILGCAGDERLRFPEHGTASIVVNPTYFSIYGTVGLITLLKSGSDNGSSAAVLATVAGNSSLEPDIGSHSVSNLRALVRDRMVYGKTDRRHPYAPPPAGSLASFFSHCEFTGTPINMECSAAVPSPPPRTPAPRKAGAAALAPAPRKTNAPPRPAATGTPAASPSAGPAPPTTTPGPRR